jgi:hypothetical protein
MVTASCVLTPDLPELNAFHCHLFFSFLLTFSDYSSGSRNVNCHAVTFSHISAVFSTSAFVTMNHDL